MKEYILDAHSYYTTVTSDLNSYNTHILENIIIIYSDGEKEECQLQICNNRVSYDRTSGMCTQEELDEWIADAEDPSTVGSVCPECIKEWKDKKK